MKPKTAIKYLEERGEWVIVVFFEANDGTQVVLDVGAEDTEAKAILWAHSWQEANPNWPDLIVSPPDVYERTKATRH